MTLKKAARLALLLTLPALVLVGCGRKGDLDRPGATTLNTRTPAGTAETKDTVEDRPFLLDPLL
ncbi:lipoprotein [Sinorhizobium numidicum]|uniref:Lipoprotein n=1 Tax=Sinorhizobium numidicum TaxID=680248 RepID=A0ABY8CZB4_9HYPH|nr:lipoprotein [Sinorhizobium numidicum]WEX76806.1 lipoprotein [Sinorhizobium numidicum]WEX83467.1 lipoprotein [Sinorhizobium numidicum]